MAQKISVLLLDDLDGTSEAADTITFGLDGMNYEIDLSVEHADEFRDLMAKYVGAARKGQAPSLRARKAGTAPRPNTSEAATIRTWAREQGIPVPERGRLPLDVLERYHSRGSAPAPEPETAEVQAEPTPEPEPVTVVDVTDAEDKPKRSRSRKAKDDAGPASLSALLP